MTAERGRITNIKRSLQVKDYSGLRYGKITPSDIDGCVEFNEQLFVFIELKYRNAPMPFGQKLCLERICKNLSKPSYVILARHEVDDDGEDIKVAVSMVEKVYHNGEWRNPPEPMTVKALIDYLRGKHGILSF